MYHILDLDFQFCSPETKHRAFFCSQSVSFPLSSLHSRISEHETNSGAHLDCHPLGSFFVLDQIRCFHEYYTAQRSGHPFYQIKAIRICERISISCCEILRFRKRRAKQSEGKTRRMSPRVSGECSLQEEEGERKSGEAELRYEQIVNSDSTHICRVKYDINLKIRVF